MNYYHIAKDDYPIGFSEVEAANKVLVTQCLKRTGQRWGRDRGREVLSCNGPATHFGESGSGHPIDRDYGHRIIHRPRN